MFSKNKTAIAFIKYSASSRRNAFRVVPEYNALSLQVLGQRVDIVNISSSGVAFSLQPNTQLKVPMHTSISGCLSLHHYDSEGIQVTLTVKETLNDIYRCQIQLPRRGFNTLCSYLVKKQINDIRELQKI